MNIVDEKKMVHTTQYQNSNKTISMTLKYIIFLKKNYKQHMSAQLTIINIKYPLQI